MPTAGRLIQAIQAHLAAHPQAADSADGVARWWLATQSVPASTPLLEQALQTLVARGVLRRVVLADGNLLYCSATALAAAKPQ